MQTNNDEMIDQVRPYMNKLVDVLCTQCKLDSDHVRQIQRQQLIEEINGRTLIFSSSWVHRQRPMKNSRETTRHPTVT